MHFVTRRNIFLFNILLWLNKRTFSTGSTQAADHNWDKFKPGECYSNDTYIECELRDDDARVFEKNLWGRMKSNCQKKVNAIALFEDKMPKNEEYNPITLFKIECFQLPDIMNRDDIAYKAIVHYSNQTFGKVRQSSDGIHRLRLIYSAHDLKLPAKLFQDSEDMTHVSIMISGTAKSGDFYENLFAHVENLEMIEIHVFGTSKALTFKSVNVLYPIKYLDLSLNQIEVLPVDMFATFPELNCLHLRANMLKTLPINAFEKQQKLLILDLSYNSLDHLPAGIFKHAPLLWQLILAENSFLTPTSIIDNISGLRYLYKLDLSGNELTTPHGDVSVGHKTMFSSFKVRVASDSFVELMPNLSIIYAQFDTQIVSTKEINLNNNRFTYFDMAWLQEAQLGCDFVIDLSYNAIKHINITTAIFNTTKSCGTTIELENNPLECDCKLTWLANNNYLKNPFNLQCIVTPFENSAVTHLQRSETCDWLPALCPVECVCRLDAEALLINCEGAALNELPHLPRPEPFARKLSMLSLSHNNLHQLPSNVTIGYANVTHLNASHNQLLTLRPTELPAKLVVLDVRHNRLEHLSKEFFSIYLNESGTLQQLYLAGNPWKCDCSAGLLLYAVRTQRKRIADVDAMICKNLPNALMRDIKFSDICGTSHIATIVTTCFGALIIAILFIFALYYKFRKQVNAWLYYHKVCLCCINEEELDKDKTFDAFISYAHKDEHFVNQMLLPQLEQGEPPFRICTHERNWLAGAYIPEQIVESVSQSCRTIIILSQHFIESDWGRMEFRTAHQCSLNEGRARIIIIKYGEISCTELLDEELKAYLDANTYLDWTDPTFWKKLRYAMPHRKGESRRAGMLELNKRVYVIGDVERNNWRGERN
ncbi:protein toll-like [Zeugodacus cucurbitae]|uniref:protein toll-like n=1 Tax=Zeugodacus cucurbitae TaxID=28588 RepID=UPI0023D95B21|nr:protein toll-like [Zeugodacus cucurbitae]